MRLYQTERGPVLEYDGTFHRIAQGWDPLINRPDLMTYLLHSAQRSAGENSVDQVLAPIGSQEVWAAGVTYYRSRTARLEESKVGAFASASTSPVLTFSTIAVPYFAPELRTRSASAFSATHCSSASRVRV